MLIVSLSIIKVQAGFICANLPYMRSLAIRCRQRRHAHAKISNSSNSHNIVPYSHRLSSRKSHPNCVGFHSLASENNTPVKITSNEFLHCYVENIGGAINMEDSRSTRPDQIKISVGQVEVQTEVRQKVERVQSSLDLRRPVGDEIKTVSTQITAM